MQHPENLVLVTDLLANVLQALGRGHRTLVRESRSELGMLAVKAAEVRVDFALSALVRSTEHGIGVGVRPAAPFGLSAALTSQERTLELGNRASVVLQIVNVLAAEERAPSPPGQGAEPLKLIVRIAQWAAGDRVLATLVSSALMGVYEVLVAGRDDEARQRAAVVLPELEALLLETGVTPPPEIRETLDALAAWAGPPDATGSETAVWRAPLRGPIVALNRLVADLEVPDDVKRDFGVATGQALLSRNLGEAQRHLLSAVERLRERTRGVALPLEIRQALDSIEIPGG